MSCQTTASPIGHSIHWHYDRSAVVTQSCAVPSSRFCLSGHSFSVHLCQFSSLHLNWCHDSSFGNMPTVQNPWRYHFTYHLLITARAVWGRLEAACVSKTLTTSIIEITSIYVVLGISISKYKATYPLEYMLVHNVQKDGSNSAFGVD